MSNENLVLRTIYIDPDLDDALTSEARAASISKAELFRRYLKAGYTAAKTRSSFEIKVCAVTPVLHTVYLDPRLDDNLRTLAFDMRIPKNNLVRYFLRVGMEL